MSNEVEFNSFRIFNAPLEAVWRVWSEPEHLKKWWGPKGFTNTFKQHEFKDQGDWVFVMHGPDGVNYDNHIRYQKIVKHRSIEFSFVGDFPYSVKVLFEALAEQTKVTFIGQFGSQAFYDQVKDFAILGNAESFDRLDAQLSSLTGNELAKEFLITREFSTDIDTLWEMWTDPTHLGQWAGPKEVKVGQASMDFRRGGSYHYSMIGGDGSESWGKSYYLDIVKPKRLMYIQTFSNEKGEITRHPMAPQFPAELLTTVFFETKGEKTLLTLRWYPVNANLDEVKMFNAAHDGMTGGWTGSFDRLTEVLVDLKA